MRADHRRLVDSLGTLDNRQLRTAYFHPSFICAFLYRIANHCFRSGHTLVARGIWQFNLLLTGADISPVADLGEGLVIVGPPGTVIMGTAGRNLTVMHCAGLGGEVGRRYDVGAGPGLARLGDDVTIGPHGAVLGPIRVGDRAYIGAAAVVTRDVPADAIVEAAPPRFWRRDRA